MKIFKQLLTALIIALLFSVVLFSGCGASYKAKRCRALNCCPTVKDSTHIVIKDSTYLVPITYTIMGDSAWMSLIAKCDSNGMTTFQLYQYYEGQYLKLAADTAGNTVYIMALTPERKDSALVPETSHSEVSNNVQVIEKTTNILKPWQKFILWSGYIAWILAILLVLYGIYRIYKAANIIKLAKSFVQ